MKALMKEAPVLEGTILIRIVSVRRTPTQIAPRLLSEGGCQKLPVGAAPMPSPPHLGPCLFKPAAYTASPPESVCASPAPARTWGGGNIKPAGTPLFLPKVLQPCSLLTQMERWAPGMLSLPPCLLSRSSYNRPH